jgi:hypothetical protein
VDARSAVRLVRDPRRVALWRALLDLEAAAARADDDPTAADLLAARAAALAAAAAAEWPDAALSAGPRHRGR